MWSDAIASLSVTLLGVLWSGGLLGRVASGAAGFAAGVVASAVWLHAIAPVHVAVLVVAGGLVMQCTRLWTLRHALDVRRLWPFIAAGVLGVPVGVWPARRAALPAGARGHAAGVRRDPRFLGTRLVSIALREAVRR
jgi:uncharacterized membrane protein YfcA